MAYQSGFLKYRVTVQNKVAGKNFGETTKFQDVATVWASVTFTKGMKAMHEGALDAYDTVMIRMRWNNFTTRDSLLIYDGITYQILSFHADKQENEIPLWNLNLNFQDSTFVKPNGDTIVEKTHSFTVSF